jgi:hypothetical protein
MSAVALKNQDAPSEKELLERYLKAVEALRRAADQVPKERQQADGQKKPSNFRIFRRHAK